jgi:hypothetical protein
MIPVPDLRSASLLQQKIDHRVKPGDDSLCREASIHPSRRVSSSSSINFRPRRASNIWKRFAASDFLGDREPILRLFASVAALSQL